MPQISYITLASGDPFPFDAATFKRRVLERWPEAIFVDGDEEEVVLYYLIAGQQVSANFSRQAPGGLRWHPHLLLSSGRNENSPRALPILYDWYMVGILEARGRIILEQADPFDQALTALWLLSWLSSDPSLLVQNGNGELFDTLIEPGATIVGALRQLLAVTRPYYVEDIEHLMEPTVGSFPEAETERLVRQVLGDEADQFFPLR